MNSTYAIDGVAKAIISLINCFKIFINKSEFNLYKIS